MEEDGEVASKREDSAAVCLIYNQLEISCAGT